MMSCLDNYIDSLSRILSTEDIVALQEKLNDDINGRRVELADRLNEGLSIHAHQLSQSLSLVQSHSQITSKSEEIYQEIQRIKPSLNEDVEMYKAHIEDYKQAKLEHEAKSILDSVHLSLSTFSRYIESNEYAKAARYLQSDMKSNFEKLEQSFVSRWSGSSALQTEYHRLSALLTDNLTAAWDESVNCTTSSLRLKSLHGSRPLLEIVEALNTLNMFSNRFKSLFNNVNEYFVDVLLPPSTCKGLIPTVVTSEDTLTLQRTTEAPIKSTQLRSLALLLKFINERYEDLGKHVTPLVLGRLMDVYLLPSLPDRLGGPEVALFRRKVAESVAFEKEVSQEGVIKNISQSWGQYWIQKRQTRALKETRSMILRPDWDIFAAEIEVLVEDSVSSGNHSTENTTGFGDIDEDDAKPSTKRSTDETKEYSDSHIHVEDYDDEDGWGLDEDEEVVEEPATIEKVDSKTSIASLKDDVEQDADMDEDGWGLDDEEDIEQLQDGKIQDKKIQKPELPRTESRSSITSPQPNITANDDDDGWGLDDEEEVDSAVDKQDTPVNQISDDDDPWKDGMNDDEAAAPPPKEDSTSEDGWGLDDEEPGKPAEVHVQDSSKTEDVRHTHIPQQASVKQQSRQKRSIVVSEYVKQLIAQLDDVYSDREYLMHTDEIPSSDNDLSKEATSVAESIIDIYRCLFPHAHQETLKLVPALALQFANDCEYMSHQVSQRQLSNSSEKLAMLKKSILIDVDVEQRRQLVDILTDAGPLTDLSINHERAFAGLIASFSRLRSSVKGVIRTDQLNQLLGSIAEFVMRFVIEAVEDLDDISEEDSNKLCKMCRDLQAGLQGVFEENGTQGYKHTSNWFKFAYLSEILQANLVDLSYLHKEGSLVDFSADELVRLCKALFADTDKRANVIDNLIAASTR